MAHFKALGRKAFPTISKDICYVVYERDHSGASLVTDVNGNSARMLLGPDVEIIPSNNVEAHKILMKVKRDDHLGSAFTTGSLHNSKIKETPKSTKGAVRIMKTVGGKDKEPDIVWASLPEKDRRGLGTHKVVMGKANGNADSPIGELKIVGPDCAVSHTVAMLAVASEKEAKSLVSFLKTKLARYVLSTVKTQTYNTAKIFKNLPMVDLSGKWSDEDAYLEFALSRDEVSLIESSID